jgi:hypothetical protein
MGSVSGVDNHLGKNNPLRQSEQEEQQQHQKEKLSPYVKRILVVDDDPDITLHLRD